VIVPFTRKRDLRGLNEPTFSGKYCRWLLRSNILVLLWIRDWKGSNSWKLWWIRIIQLSGPVRAHLGKLRVWNPELCTGYNSWWSDPHWPMAPQFGGLWLDTRSVGGNSVGYKISLSGYRRWGEDGPSSCNGSPPGTPSSLCDDWSRGPGKELQTNVQTTVET
jgi:hypothetical protein